MPYGIYFAERTFTCGFPYTVVRVAAAQRKRTELDFMPVICNEIKTLLLRAWGRNHDLEVEDQGILHVSHGCFSLTNLKD
jgi:hypothetical protein